ncbi:MAG: DUF86 domain-containing protein [Proteobacteria bacterium]|nr:DUF86 domain-containing protein [Pseudomonadota bacterium]
MKLLNIDKLYAKFRDIRDSVGRLRRFGDISLDEFLKDKDKQDIASFRLIVATEAAIDICLHVAAKVLREVPEEYAGCFQLLGDRDLIDRELSLRLAKMARFRNLLVHRYWEIDYTRMYQVITGPDLADLEEFILQISRLSEA